MWRSTRYQHRFWFQSFDVDSVVLDAVYIDAMPRERLGCLTSWGEIGVQRLDGRRSREGFDVGGGCVCGVGALRSILMRVSGGGKV